MPGHDLNNQLVEYLVDSRSIERNAIRAPDRRVEGELQRSKEPVEAGGHRTGRWRGEIERPDESVE